jgi:hypothetical protein
MGLGLLAHGRDLQTNPPWDFSLRWEENIARGYKPVPADLAAGRRTSAALVALTTVALIAVAHTFVSLPWANVAGLLFAIHPFAIYIGSIAMADAVFGLLIALAAWAAVLFARAPGWPRTILLGALLGLGAATKLSPLAVAVGLGAAAASLLAVAALRQRLKRHAPLVSFRRRRNLGSGSPTFAAHRDSPPARNNTTPLQPALIPRREATFALHGLLVVAAALVTFVASYPYLWPDPVARTRNLFAFRAEEMATQAADWPVMAVPTRAEALRRVGVNFTERYSLSGAIAAWFGRGSIALPVRQVELMLPLAGIALMTAMAARDGPYSPRMLALAVLGGQVVVTILSMRSEFDRYHLPMALLGAVAASVALSWITGRIIRGAKMLARARMR